jgi:phage FluMu gp28-like protein
MNNTQSILTQILLPWQQAWVEDNSRFKIGMWSRQTGKSFSTACEAVTACAAQERNSSELWVVLSAGERQALEWMEKAKKWAKAIKATVDSYDELRASADALISRAEIRFANGSRIVAIPANPDTARGYSGNLILDEFAIHEKPFDIWAAIYP